MLPEVGEYLEPLVRHGADGQGHPIPGEPFYQFGVLPGSDPVVDAPGAEDVQSRADVSGRTFLTGVGDRDEPGLDRYPVGLGEQLRRVALLARVETHSLDVFEVGPGRLQRLDGGLGG